MKRRQEEIITVYTPEPKRRKIEDCAIGAGDDGLIFEIKVHLCGKCKKLTHDSNLQYIETTKQYLCKNCDTKG